MLDIQHQDFIHKLLYTNTNTLLAQTHQQ